MYNYLFIYNVGEGVCGWRKKKKMLRHRLEFYLDGGEIK